MKIAICDDEEHHISKIKKLMTKRCIDSKKFDFYELKNMTLLFLIFLIVLL